MATNKRQFTMRMQHANFEKMKFIAESEKRSLASQIEILIENAISEYEDKHGPIDIKDDN